MLGNGMDSKKYIKQALVTEARDWSPVASRLGETPNIRVLHAAMGLSTEANEILDHMKKVVFYGKPMDRVNLLEEVGDLFWYCAILCDELGVTFEEVMEININKLRARYGDKFSETDALERDLETERKILETKDLTTLKSKGMQSMTLQQWMKKATK